MPVALGRLVEVQSVRGEPRVARRTGARTTYHNDTYTVYIHGGAAQKSPASTMRSTCRPKLVHAYSSESGVWNGLETVST